MSWDTTPGSARTPAQIPPVDEPRAYDWRRGLGLDWKMADQVKSHGPLKSSAAAFVPSHQDQYAHPRIFVEPRSAQEAFHAHRRMSAIEIAHQYRLKRDFQNTLPTPPASSSPQWSPYLRAHPSFTSPILSTSQFPGSASVQQFNQHLAAYYRQSFAFEGDSGRDYNVAPIDEVGISTQVLKPSRHQHSGQGTSYVSAVPSNKSCTVDIPPPHPGSPPDAPLPPAFNRIDVISRLSQPKQRSVEMAPLSPTSPEPRIRSLSHQQPRSIPLARLIQRRLSSVPEEDLSSSFGKNRPALSPTLHRPRLVHTHATHARRTRTQAHPSDIETHSVALLGPTGKVLESTTQLQPIETGIHHLQATVKVPPLLKANNSMSIHGVLEDSKVIGERHDDNGNKGKENATKVHGATTTRKKRVRGRKGTTMVAVHASS